MAKILNRRCPDGRQACRADCGPGIDTSRLAMLEGIEFIEFDPEHPDEARDKLVQRMAGMARGKEQQTELLLILIAALVVAFLLLSIPSG